MSVRIATLQILDGTVKLDHTSEPIDATFWDAVADVQRNERREYWEIIDTQSGVVKYSRNGLVTIVTVKQV